MGRSWLWLLDIERCAALVLGRYLQWMMAGTGITQAPPIRSIDPPTNTQAPPTRGIAPPINTQAPPTAAQSSSSNSRPSSFHSQTPPTNSRVQPTSAHAPPTFPPISQNNRVFSYGVPGVRFEQTPAVDVHRQEATPPVGVTAPSATEDVPDYHIAGVPLDHRLLGWGIRDVPVETG